MIASSMPWILSGMEDKNKPLEAPFTAFLESVVRNDAVHALFLNMLSLMEHIGSRKIMVSQMHGTMAPETLKHLAEEARHAHFFKMQAGKFAGKPVDDYTEANTMTRGAAAMYFGRLDTAIASDIGATSKSDICYLWVSLIVELRACWTYHAYQAVLQKAQSTLSLKSILAEENLHLLEMYEQIKAEDNQADQRLERLCSVETALFRRFWAQLSLEIPKNRENLAPAA